MNEFDKDSMNEQETGELKNAADTGEMSSNDESSGAGGYGNVSTRDYLNQMAQRANQQTYQNGAGGYTGNTYTGQYTGSQNAGNQYSGNQYTGNQYTGSTYAGNQFTGYNADASAAGYNEKQEEKKAKKVKAKQRKKAKTGKVKNKSGKAAGFFKKATGVVVAAAVFGLVAGGVFRLVTRDALDELKNAGGSATEASTDKASTEELQNKDTTIEATTVLDSTAETGVSTIAANAMPSVVAIHITAVEEVDQGFFGSYQYETEGSGSGIIIDENDDELLIVTNNHVVSDAETVNVDFIDGETYDAKVKGTDSDTDLAIIVVPLEDLSESTLSQIKIAQLGDSDSLQVGEQVVAIGNALGYGQSVTTGIVSALNRENSTNSTPLIQTDAAINPGNSGGALLNMKGELIGINSSKYADTDVEGMGYAIPVSSVTDVLENLMNMKTRDKVDEDKMGYLGIECGTVTEEMQYYYGAPAGVYVSKVTDGSAADLAGIPKNSIITSLDGKSVESVDDLTSILEYYESGETVVVKYSVMKNNEYVEKSANVTLGRKPTE
jgi:serine protease Do